MDAELEVAGDRGEHGLAIEAALLDAGERLTVVATGEQALLRRGAGRQEQDRDREGTPHQRASGR